MTRLAQDGRLHPLGGVAAGRCTRRGVGSLTERGHLAMAELRSGTGNPARCSRAPSPQSAPSMQAMYSRSTIGRSITEFSSDWLDCSAAGTTPVQAQASGLRGITIPHARGFDQLPRVRQRGALRPVPAPGIRSCLKRVTETLRASRRMNTPSSIPLFCWQPVRGARSAAPAASARRCVRPLAGGLPTPAGQVFTEDPHAQHVVLRDLA